MYASFEKKHVIQIVETESFESALSVKRTKALQPTGTLLVCKFVAVARKDLLRFQNSFLCIIFTFPYNRP